MDTIPAPLKGKVALVTGGSRGIGAGIAETFARQGCTHIAITYTSKPDLAEGTLATIKAINSTIKTFAFQCDVRSPDCGRLAVEQTLSGLGVNHIDIMVSNAALVDMSQLQNIEDTTYEGFMEMITGNTWTPFLLARESAKVMPSGGRIILISSVNSKLAHGDPSLGYGTAKAGMDAVARNLAAQYGPEKKITVNSISVGPTETAALRIAFEQHPEYKELSERLTLLKRVGQVQEVAVIVAFVASPQASWITGNQIPANGGILSALQG